MKLQFCSIGKAHESYVKEGIELFTKRISNYYPVQWNIIPMPKNAGAMNDAELKATEGKILMTFFKKENFIVLLDEKGKQINSEGLAALLQQRANESEKNIIFLIGGAYGVSDEVFRRADYKWSLSQLVFPHQLVRLMLAEQVYRACSILRNEQYHHS